MKKLYKFLITIVILLLLPLASFATDLPIDPDHIGQQNEAGQDVITARRRVDLFSELAREVNQAIVRQREQWHDSTNSSLFGEPGEHSPIDMDSETLQAAEDSRLFSQPVRFGSGMAPSDESQIPFWVTAVVLAGATGLGLAIAVIISAKRKEKEKNVHNNNN